MPNSDASRDASRDANLDAQDSAFDARMDSQVTLLDGGWTDAGDGATVCSQPRAICGNTCADLTSDPEHCNACNNVCPAVANAEATCVNRMCGSRCLEGYVLCGNLCVAITPTTCNDGNTSSGDGCNTACQTEVGFVCEGTPSVCRTVCGDGLRVLNEMCDDNNLLDGDGCSALCQVETGFTCGASGCAPICGDRLLRGSEQCDYGDRIPGDGCSAFCSYEEGWSCNLSGCTSLCGDGLRVGAEVCDDDNMVSGDGCSMGCAEENGWTCTGSPSVCTTRCGDRLVVGGEACDAGNPTTSAGCTNSCTVVTGWTCSGSPSTCAPVCGDGRRVGAETCDDGARVNGDGCNSNCAIESGFTCTGAAGALSTCNATCGDSRMLGAETCDDGNTNSGDGCSNQCRTEASPWQCINTPNGLSDCYARFTTAEEISLDEGQCNFVGTTVQVSGISCAVQNVRASAEIYHNWVGDVRLSLFNPQGTEVFLIDRPGNNSTICGQGSGDDGRLSGIYTFVNGASTFPENSSGIVTPGNYSPTNSTGGRNNLVLGSSTNGEWLMRFYDFNSGVGGAVSNFTVDMRCHN